MIYKLFFKLIKYFVINFNYILFKPFLGLSQKFYIEGIPTILGGESISLGSNFYANKGLRIEIIAPIKDNFKLQIGNDVSLGRNVHIAVSNVIIIKSGVLIGSNILITDHNHGIYNGINQSSPEIPPVKRLIPDFYKVIIEENVWIGDGVVILPGVTIGKGSIIGSNSVVNKNISSNVIAAGNPVREIKKYDFENRIWSKI